MNPWNLDATALMVWGLVVHLIADWPLQNDWMANNKARVWNRSAAQQLEPWRWWDNLRWLVRHPAAYVHAGIHGALLALIFGWVAAPLALAHLVIDTRVPVIWWSRFVRQTQPEGLLTATVAGRERPLYDVGLEVRFWTDQVFHIACIAAAALVVA